MWPRMLLRWLRLCALVIGTAAAVVLLPSSSWADEPTGTPSPTSSVAVEPEPSPSSEAPSSSPSSSSTSEPSATSEPTVSPPSPVCGSAVESPCYVEVSGTSGLVLVFLAASSAFFGAALLVTEWGR